MRTRTMLLLVLLVAAAPVSHAQAIPPQVVEIRSGPLHLVGYFWRPPGYGPFPAVLFAHGSGEQDAAHSSGMLITEAAERLAPIFIKHGYAFLFAFRRGQGPSADQAPFMRDVLQGEEATRGIEARQHLQYILMTTEQLDDVLAALSLLKSMPGIDPRRIAIVGHSFGGQLALVAAERDTTFCAVVTFGAAALSWGHSPEVRARLIEAVAKTAAPIMLIHAANDYSTTPGHALGDELDRLHASHVLKIYPAVGRTPNDGHNMVYGATDLWEADVFDFLDKYAKR